MGVDAVDAELHAGDSDFGLAIADCRLPRLAITGCQAPTIDCRWQAFVRDHLGPVLEADHPGVDIYGFDHNKDHVVEWATGLCAAALSPWRRLLALMPPTEPCRSGCRLGARRNVAAVSRRCRGGVAANALASSRPLDTACRYNDSSAARYFRGVAVHWYGGLNTDKLDAAHEIDDSKEILATEACNCVGNVIFAAPNIAAWWTRAEKLALDMLEDLKHWAVGWCVEQRTTARALLLLRCCSRRESSSA